MPMLRRGCGPVRNLRCKSGARFPPSTDWMYLAKTCRCALGPWLLLDVSGPHTHTAAYKEARNSRFPSIFIANN